MVVWIIETAVLLIEKRFFCINRGKTELGGATIKIIDSNLILLSIKEGSCAMNPVKLAAAPQKNRFKQVFRAQLCPI